MTTQFSLLFGLMLIVACSPSSNATNVATSGSASAIIETTHEATQLTKPSVMDNKSRLQQAAQAVLMYAQARHCGDAGLISTNDAQRFDHINVADAVIVLDENKVEEPDFHMEEQLMAVLYYSDVLNTVIALPTQGETGAYGCSAGSGTSSYYLPLVTYSSHHGGGLGVSHLDVFQLIHDANAQERQQYDSFDNPYIINPRFIQSVKKVGNHLEIVSAQYGSDADSNNFPTSRWQYTVRLFDWKIISSQKIGDMDYTQFH